jgi:hypothetical protein
MVADVLSDSPILRQTLEILFRHFLAMPLYQKAEDISYGYIFTTEHFCT